jgi:RNA polymerase primary sigma factor
MERIRDSLLHLSDREAQVIQLYYGLGEDEQHSLEEIGRRIGVGRERVRQIRVRALRKIQRSVIPFAERAGARA